MKYTLPITKKTFYTMINQWIKIINNHDSASILNISKRSQIYRINQFLNATSYLKKNIRDYSKTQIFAINLSAIEEEGKALKNYLETVIDKNKKRIVILLLHSDVILLEKPELACFFDEFVLRKPQCSLLYFFEKNILLTQFLTKFNRFSSLYQNIIITPLYSKEDVNHFISFNQKKYKIQLSSSLKNEIIAKCGGRLWLITEAIRFYAKTKDVKNIFNHEEMDLKIKAIFNEFEECEKAVLEKIVKNDAFFNSEEREIISYFLKTHLLSFNGRHYLITIPLLTDFIRSEMEKKSLLQLNSKNQLILNNVILDGYFSHREKRLLSFLIKNKNRLISREQVARALWRFQYYDSYTDWALDQALRRLRIKLSRLGVNPNIIKTKRNQGFIYQL